MARSSAQSVHRYPLTLILGTEANVRLLRELSGHGGQLSAQGLALRTGLSGSTVRAGLAALLESRIVSVAGSGHARLFSIHQDHRLRPALNALFVAEAARFDAVLNSVRTAALESGSGLAAVWLYGSVARGGDNFDSDIDIAVIAKDDAVDGVVRKLRDRLVAPGEKLGFSPAIVGLGLKDVARLARQRDPWWIGVARDAVALIGPRPEDLKRARAISARAAA